LTLLDLLKTKSPEEKKNREEKQDVSFYSEKTEHRLSNNSLVYWTLKLETGIQLLLEG
jgi:hypothetical protein